MLRQTESMLVMRGVFLGGDGAGAAFVDMEQGWNLNHEDLTAAGITPTSRQPNYFLNMGRQFWVRCDVRQRAGRCGDRAVFFR